MRIEVNKCDQLAKNLTTISFNISLLPFRYWHFYCRSQLSRHTPLLVWSDYDSRDWIHAQETVYRKKLMSLMI